MATHQRTMFVSSLGILGLTPVFAGCASAEVTNGTQESGQSVVAAEEAVTKAPEEALPGESGGSYADGSYSAQGGYQSPSGPETIGLSLTLENGVINAIEVTPEATERISQRYQGQFAEAIVAETMGKSLDELNVGRIAGSSLTSGGFNEALTAIKADANR
jgi:uncharacterized protein with FMN-binding domain